MKKIYKKLFENNTFQNIELIDPRYFGECRDCDKVWLLHCRNSFSKYISEWICPYCEKTLDIYKFKRRKSSLIDMQKQIIRRRKQNENTLGIFK